MSRKLRIAYLAHSLRSDWNNGNAHFLRGLLREMLALGHDVDAFEPAHEWSLDNLRTEEQGEASLQQFAAMYPELHLRTYDAAESGGGVFWSSALKGMDVVILHEWNPPALAHALLELRDTAGFKLLLHDTHHRASSSPEQIRLFGTDRFDGVIAFGEALRRIYREHFGLQRVWTLHEAADTTVFKPMAGHEKKQDVVWIGNWGDDERSREIREFLLAPASRMRDRRFVIYGVRYPDEALAALNDAAVGYGGYLPNLEAPRTYAESRLTVHVPRQQYAQAMDGIPTIRVFEALACGIPLISAPWNDSERLFGGGDFLFAHNADEMQKYMQHLLDDPAAAEAQAQRGLETVLARHTCRHRAEELTLICEEVLR
jgi:spore maturation protein CgeB